MNETKVDFAAHSWKENAAGARCKEAARNGKKLRVVEFTEEFVERDWCLKAHAGYVLDGEMEITFAAAGTERFVAGDGLIIAHGERHKARVTGTKVKLLLVEDED